MEPSELHVGLPPQSEDEIAPIRAALRARCNDPLLDLRWNGQSFKRKDTFGVTGAPMHAKWEGRWEVIRYDTDRLHLDRPYAVILTMYAIDPPNQIRKYPIMQDRGDYLPVDWRIVDYMQLVDRAQGRLAEELMQQAWAEHDLAERLEHPRDAHVEALEKVYRTHGGEYWMGGAQGKADPVTEKGLWGRVKDAASTLFGGTDTPTSASAP